MEKKVDKQNTLCLYLLYVHITLFIAFFTITLFQQFILFPSLSLMDELSYKNYFSYALNRIDYLSYAIMTVEIMTAVLMLCIRTKLLKKWALSFNLFVLALSIVFFVFVIKPQQVLLSHGFAEESMTRLAQLNYGFITIMLFRAFLLIYLIFKSQQK